jgi:tRNA threonylcarbamoyladenosine biosynthesis protein TsaB
MLALLREGESVRAVSVPAGARTAEMLFTEVAALLTAAGTTAAEVQRVVVGTGPGSFTGVRIAMASALGMQAALPHCAIVGVDAFTATRAAAQLPLHVSCTLTLLPGLPGQVFAQWATDAAVHEEALPLLDVAARTQQLWSASTESRMVPRLVLGGGIAAAAVPHSLLETLRLLASETPTVHVCAMHATDLLAVDIARAAAAMVALPFEPKYVAEVYVTQPREKAASSK